MSNLVLDWNAMAAQILNLHSSPGHDTRRFAIFQIAIHNAINAIEEKYARYASTGAPDATASYQAAIVSAAYKVLYWAITDVTDYSEKMDQAGLPRLLFDATAHYKSILDKYNLNLANIPEGPAKAKGTLIGNNAADAIITDRHKDKCDEVELLSIHPNDGNKDGEFRSTYYTSPPPIPSPPKNKYVVKFGNVKTFSIPNASKFRQNPNYLSPNDKEKDYNESKTKGRNDYDHSPGDKNIMEVWSNNKQHIIWNNIASGIMTALGWDEWKTARLFALIHTAMADGAISMFNDVYYFYKWRPATAFNIPPVDTAWIPGKLPVPRVPEYPSTYGILGGAAGEILKNAFPNSVPFNVKSTAVTLNYTNFSTALNDMTNATVYCGFNFRKSTVDGITQGREIGNYVYENEFLDI